MPLDFQVYPDEVVLTDAPLIRVLCQIRYSAVPELVDNENERALAKLLTEQLPVRGLVQGMVLPLQAISAPVAQGEHFRTFEDPVGTWKATVAPDFVALETTQYGRRDEFLTSLAPVLRAVETVSRPPRVTRIGIRYTDRILNPEGVDALVHPALLGLLPELTDHDMVENQVVQTLIRDLPSARKVQVRSLCLPEGVSFDPSIDPVSVPSWVLDIDAFNESLRIWEHEVLMNEVEVLAKRAYQVFHWATRDAFRARYGKIQTEVTG